MLPVIAIVGRPNVGKSTLFNRLTRTQAALVADMPGVTRDRQFGEAKCVDRQVLLVDTGGLEEDASGISEVMVAQSRQAIIDSDIVLFMVDAGTGLCQYDQQIAHELRQLDKPVYLIVNKIDGHNPDVVMAEFFEIGLTEIFPIAAVSGRGLNQLMEALYPVLPLEVSTEHNRGIHVAIIGRPNVGKSTLVNRILGEERVVVYDQPGTTRDSIYIPFERHGEDYTLIDTAGVRRRSKVDVELERGSVIKTIQAINAANVVVFIVDAQENITEQDLRLLGLIIRSGRSLLIAVNKWDGLTGEHREFLKKELDRRLDFVRYAHIHFISALHGTGVGDIFSTIKKAYRSATQDLQTSQLTRILEDAVRAHEPPIVNSRRIKLRYAHAGGKNPPLIVIHGNQTDQLPKPYQRYLANYFRESLKLVGTPIRIELRTGENPYKDNKNKLTDRQVRRRRRLMQHVKSKK